MALESFKKGQIDGQKLRVNRDKLGQGESYFNVTEQEGIVKKTIYSVGHFVGYSKVYMEEMRLPDTIYVDENGKIVDDPHKP